MVEGDELFGGGFLLEAAYVLWHMTSVQGKEGQWNTHASYINAYITNFYLSRLQILYFS